jgi:hypothetical protein
MSITVDDLIKKLSAISADGGGSATVVIQSGGAYVEVASCHTARAKKNHCNIYTKDPNAEEVIVISHFNFDIIKK